MIGLLAAVVFGGLEGVAMGSMESGLFGVLLGLKIGKDKVLWYQQNLEAGKCLVAVRKKSTRPEKFSKKPMQKMFVHI